MLSLQHHNFIADEDEELYSRTYYLVKFYLVKSRLCFNVMLKITKLLSLKMSVSVVTQLHLQQSIDLSSSLTTTHYFK